jgi:hypothetical protein
MTAAAHWTATAATQSSPADEPCPFSEKHSALPRTQLTAAAADLGLAPEQRDSHLGGYVSAAFFAVGAPAAMIVCV